jgi:hypothetical protein
MSYDSWRYFWLAEAAKIGKEKLDFSKLVEKMVTDMRPYGLSY